MNLPSGEPGVEFTVTIRNYERALRAVEKLSNASYYRGMFRDVVPDVLASSRDYASEITHRDTGYLSASHMWEYNSHTMKGRLFINPRVVFRAGRTLKWPRIYGAYEEGRGDSHAFYERTYVHMEQRLPDTAFNLMIRTLGNVGG
jgi:hypothetical protein